MEYSKSLELENRIINFNALGRLALLEDVDLGDEA